MNQPVGKVAKDIAFGEGDHGFDAATILCCPCAMQRLQPATSYTLRSNNTSTMKI